MVHWMQSCQSQWWQNWWKQKSPCFQHFQHWPNDPIVQSAALSVPNNTRVTRHRLVIRKIPPKNLEKEFQQKISWPIRLIRGTLLLIDFIFRNNRLSLQNLKFKLKLSYKSASCKSATVHNVHFGLYVFLPTKQAETYLKSCVLINYSTYICLYLFGWRKNMIHEETVSSKL